MSDTKTNIDATVDNPVEEVEEIEEVEEETEPAGKQKSYTQHRVERAKAQKERELIKMLGVDSIEEAQSIIDESKNGEKQALAEIKQLRIELENEKAQLLESQKYRAVVNLLEGENVFDAEALANYVNLDTVELQDGRLIDTEGIVKSLKTAKPKFFATIIQDGDRYIKGKTPTVEKTALDIQKEGDHVGAITSYLKGIL